MRRGIAVLALSLCLPLAGCGGGSYTQVSSAGIPAAGAATGSAVYVNTSGSVSALGTMITVLILANQSYFSDLDYAAGRSAWNVYPDRGGYLPALDASRRVVEHDCTQPIPDWSANFKCR
jgi:hypothetical protein